MSQFPYLIFDKFIVRSPYFSYKKFQKLFSGKNIDLEIFNDEVFKEAIYLASPSLYQQYYNRVTTEFSITQKENSKLQNTILKYFNRMSTRCTPFGLFSGVALGNFIKQDNILQENNLEWKSVRDTKFDMHFLFALSKNLISNSYVKSRICFYPNNSIYKVGNKIRYIEYENNDGIRDYIISSAPFSEELEKILIFSKEGKTINELVSLISNIEFSNDEITEFIEELIENQVLVSELEPNVAGMDFLEQIISVLERIGSKCERNILVSIKKKINAIDRQLGNNVSIYSEIEKEIKSLNIDYERKYLFQTDLYYENIIELPYSWKKELKKGVSFLNKITNYNKKDNRFEEFKKAFAERFEDGEISLSFALDTEIGVGYRQDVQKKGIQPYIDDLILPASKDKKNLTIKLNPTQIILNQKLQIDDLRKKYTIKLSDQDFNMFESNWSDLPGTMSFIAEVISDDNHEKLYLNSGSGNAGRLSARFCSEKSKIHNHVKEICQKEKEISSIQILAEIIHLPESRIGNILRRPQIRDYEIPYLAKSLLPRENQIPIEDLYISIKNGKLFLRSRKLNKEIIPQLTNAHNYSVNSLPIYHFLCDLSSQNLRVGLHFDWGDLTYLYSFLPRVEYGNIILSKAQWKIKSEEIQLFLSLLNNKEQLKIEIKDWRHRRKIPQWIQWIENDSTLLVNLENEELLNMFISSVKNEETVVVEEFLSNERHKFTNQFIFSIYKNK